MSRHILNLLLKGKTILVDLLICCFMILQHILRFLGWYHWRKSVKIGNMGVDVVFF